LILHDRQDFIFVVSSPRQLGQTFLSRINAWQRRQFIPQGAINVGLDEFDNVFIAAFIRRPFLLQKD
jgi:hypothetical protein